MAEPRHRPPSNPPDASARLPALTPAGRELLEVLWRAGRPLTTRQLHDAIGRAFPHRAGRKIQTVSTLVVELMAQGWVAGEKRGGTRWVYRPAVSRGEGLTQIARWVAKDLVREPEDRLCLVLAALRMMASCRRARPRRWSTTRVVERKVLRPSRFRMLGSIDTDPSAGLLKPASCPRGPARDPGPPV